MENKESVVKEVQLKDLQPLIVEVATSAGYSEPQAAVAVGTFMQELDQTPTSAESVIKYIHMVRSKEIEEMSQKEIDMLLELKHLRRKLRPFEAKAARVGRNDACPCNSGKKFKKCCLPLSDAEVSEALKQTYHKL